MGCVNSKESDDIVAPDLNGHGMVFVDGQRPAIDGVEL